MAKFTPYESNRALFTPTLNTINSLEEVIQWAETEAPRRLNHYMNELAFAMALVNQGFARKMAYGPSDPRGRAHDLAWRTPNQGIRRITGAYYIRWRVRSLGKGVWQLYNDSREAYFIEFGISRVGFVHLGQPRAVPSKRFRRPVRKLSLIKTLEKMNSTRAYHRVWASILVSPGHKNAARGFYQFVQPSSDSHSLFSAWDYVKGIDVGNKSGGVDYGGPMLGRRLG